MFERLDAQLAAFAPRLHDDLGVPPASSGRVASAVASDLRALGPRLVTVLDGDDPVGFSARFEELIAFQSFMDATASLTGEPAVSRARVIVQNYVCFVYLKEAWLERLARELPSSSVAAMCAVFLTTGRVRAFRNAVSHARWRYSSDFSALEYWDRASADRKAPLQQFRVDQLELGFWQGLTRGVGYVAAELRRAAG